MGFSRGTTYSVVAVRSSILAILVLLSLAVPSLCQAQNYTASLHSCSPSSDVEDAGGAFDFFGKSSVTNNTGSAVICKVWCTVQRWNSGTNNWDFVDDVSTGTPPTINAMSTLVVSSGQDSVAGQPSGLYRLVVNVYVDTNPGDMLEAWTPVATHYSQFNLDAD